MARIRTIKPEFWEDETIGILSHGARLLFLGCLNLCDDEGLLRWNEMYLGSSVFPYDEIKPETVKKWMQDLIDNDLVFSYRSGKVNQQIGLIVSFHKHQRIDKPQDPKFPAPNWRDVRLKRLIAKRDDWKCSICGGEIISCDPIKKNGSKALSIDHVKPRCKGGHDYPSNLKACHISCNHSKSGSWDEENEQEINSENDSKNNSENDSTPYRKGKESEGKGNGKEGKERAKRPEVVNPFSENFTEIWSKWKDYKKAEFKFTYKSAESEQSALNELVNLSAGNEQTAAAIIFQSMSKGWKGLFELKNVQNGNSKTQKTGNSPVSGESLNQAFADFYSQK